MAGPTGLEWIRGEEEPVEGSSTVAWRTWEDTALDSPDDFSTALAETGFTPTEIADAMATRDAAQEEVRAAVAESAEDARRGALQRLRDWLAGRKVVVEERELVNLKLPLFLLAAPSAAGSTAQFTTSVERGSGLGWSISLSGTGLSGEAKVDASLSAGFEAAAGEAKLVFLPVIATAEKLRVTEAGRQSVRIDLSEMRRDEGVAPGVVLLAPDARPPIGAVEQTYPLAGDTSGAPATYKFAYKQTKSHGLKVGIKAFGADLSLESSSTLETSVSLSFGLPGGRDYELHRLAEGDGVLWAG
jgi:hypothetical protein